MAGLDIFIEKFPQSYRIDGEKFYAGRSINADEWEGLFENVLHAPVELERLEGETHEEYFFRMEKVFREDVTNKGYEMLSHIWAMFSDAFFAPSEVSKLLEECLELQRTTENQNALSALEKLIYVCHEALKVKGGIFLACD